MYKEHKIATPEGEVTLSTGKLAKLSAGSVVLQKGETVVLATADYSKRDSDLGYFPLTVEYLERYSAVGTLSGSRFNKREGFPNDDAIIAARQVDHTIRPLFPKSFNKPVNVILTLLADDGENDPEELTVLGASAALMISGIPFNGPVASVTVAVNENDGIEVNPRRDHDNNDWKGHFVISGNQDKLLNIEGWGKELSDEVMDAVVDAGMDYIGRYCKAQHEFVAEVGKPRIEVEEVVVDPEIEKIFMEQERNAIEKALYIADKQERGEALNEVFQTILDKHENEEQEVTKGVLSDAYTKAQKKIMRQNVLEKEQRLSGRKLDEIRELDAEVDVLPDVVHGSALFSRGFTQSLSMVTLGSTRKSVGFDDMAGEEIDMPFMHHYNFPQFSVGEAGRVRYRPGRREIGHGKIGENALMNMIPDQDEFPYTVRAVSEIMTSNGSTSMAATCASSLALMAAGVPLKEAVAGIGVGLVAADPETQEEYKLLLDIEGTEDFFGDMDFKVTGTKNGMTAIQFETKLAGVKADILKEAFRLANKGRQEVLKVMNAAIAEPRAELSDKAPRVETVQVPTDMIGDIIGPGGKVIKAIVADASDLGGGESEIDIQDDGSATITAPTKGQLKFVKSQIKLIIDGPKEGAVYSGEVVNIVEFGAFVNIGYGIEGLVHISEIADKHVKKVEDFLKTGQKVTVKLIDKTPGRYSFSMKQVESN